MENTNLKPEQEVKIDETKVKLATDALESHRKEIKTKLYAIKADDKLLEEFKSFISNDAQWKGMEALGIEELHKAFDAMTGIKNGVLYLKNLEVDALHYFLAKVDGKGKESASAYLRMIRSVNDALKAVQSDNAQQIRLEHEKAAAEQGIAIDDTANSGKVEEITED